MILKEGDCKIRLVITEEGLESCHILGGSWKKRARAVKLYLAIQQEIQSFEEAIKERFLEHGENKVAKL